MTKDKKIVLLFFVLNALVGICRSEKKSSKKLNENYNRNKGKEKNSNNGLNYMRKVEVSQSSLSKKDSQIKGSRRSLNCADNCNECASHDGGCDICNAGYYTPDNTQCINY